MVQPRTNRPNKYRKDGKREGRGKYVPKRKVCAFCVDKVETIDYKDVSKLRRYMSVRAKIEPRRRTGTCAKHQRALAVALKRARHLALLPFTPAQFAPAPVRQSVIATAPAPPPPPPPPAPVPQGQG
ncbi:MAG: 30S ribosomal protein S18 [Chloroflexi bacterium]|nr:30S ribosomal protein S18 [Chloroflexota bacterium]